MAWQNDEYSQFDDYENEYDDYDGQYEDDEDEGEDESQSNAQQPVVTYYVAPPAQNGKQQAVKPQVVKVPAKGAPVVKTKVKEVVKPAEPKVVTKTKVVKQVVQAPPKVVTKYKTKVVQAPPKIQTKYKTRVVREPAKTKVIYKTRSTTGIFAMVLSFIFGIIFTVAGLFGGAFFVVKYMKLKDIAQVVGIDYTQYLNEAYGNATIYGSLDKVQEFAKKAQDQTLCLNDFAQYSPQVHTQVQKIADKLEEKIGVVLPLDGENGLMATPISGIVAFAKRTAGDTVIVDVLEKLDLGLDLDNPLFATVLYPTVLDEHGNVVKQDGKVVRDTDNPRTLRDIRDVFSEGGDILAAFGNVTINELLGNSASDDNAIMSAFGGYTINELKDSTFMEEITIGELLNVDPTDPNTSSVMIALKDYTLKDLTGSGEKEIMDLKIGDLLNVDSTDPNTSPVMLALKDYTLNDLTGNGEKDIMDLKIGALLSVDPTDPDTSSVMIALKDYTLKDLTGSGEKDIMDLKIGALMGVDPTDPDQNSMMLALSEYSLKELNSGAFMDQVTIGELLGVTASSPDMLKAIQNFSLNDLSDPNKINDLKLSDLLGNDAMESNNIMKALKAHNATLGHLADEINEITIQEIMGDTIYEADGVTLKGVWRYLLTDDVTGQEQALTINQMDSLTHNMAANVQKATLQQLSDDGIISGITQADLNRTIPFSTQRVGDLTISGLIHAIATIPSI
ncbi:MAG: hypothetical protein J6S22_02205 [Clostridia bacterium]|nr:hypothetical protein [Clostridia bacterium]